MKKSNCFLLFAIMLVGLLFTGCNDSGFYPNIICTEIGCNDGVTIRISEERPDSLSFSIYLNSDTDVFASTQCTDPDQPCILRIEGETPLFVRAEIGWENGEFTKRYNTEYENFQPNGPDCPPTCAIALIEIDLSGE